MSRAHCLDCGTDVPVDTLGHCPEGHLLPRHGRMVESAIGTDDHHPDEPEPWVGRVDLLVEEHEDVTPSAQPRTAPGMEQAEQETTAGDLLREIGALGADDPEPPSTPPSSSAPVGGHPGTNGQASVNGHASASGQASANGHAAANGQPTTRMDAEASRDVDADLTEHSALEQTLQSLDEPAAGAAPQREATPPVDDDLSALFEEFEGLGEPDDPPATGAPAAPPASERPSTPPPPPPPAASSPPPAGDQHAAAPDDATAGSVSWDAPPPSDLFDTADGAAQRAPDPEDEAEQAPSRAVVDTMNFTAKGGAMDGRRRRRGLFGR